MNLMPLLMWIITINEKHLIVVACLPSILNLFFFMSIFSVFVTHFCYAIYYYIFFLEHSLHFALRIARNRPSLHLPAANVVKFLFVFSTAAQSKLMKQSIQRKLVEITNLI